MLSLLERPLKERTCMENAKPSSYSLFARPKRQAVGSPHIQRALSVRRLRRMSRRRLRRVVSPMEYRLVSLFAE